MALGETTEKNTGLNLKSKVGFQNAITKSCVPLSIGCFLMYGILLAGLYFNCVYSSCPVCELSFSMYSPWTHTVSILVSGAFICALCIQILKLCVLRQPDQFGADLLTLTVNAISGISQMLVWFRVGPVCRDRWGVHMPAVTWAEWLVCVPLLGYIVVTLKLKPQLERGDYVVLNGLFISILMGALLHTTDSLLLSGLYLCLSSASFMVVFFTVYLARKELVMLLTKRKVDENMQEESIGFLLWNASRRFSISCIFSVMMIAFPAIYYARIFQYISNDACHVGLILCSTFAKIVFSVLMSYAHMEISSPVVSLLADSISLNSSRRKFLRYIFHEMRVPLNSISLAVQLLLEELTGNKTIEETILIIHDSVRFMGESLNDVMAIQKIEDGALQLIQKPYIVWDICSLIAGQYELEILAKNLNIDIQVADEVPKYLIGDKFRISHIISNILSNSVKFSHQGGNIEIRVNCTDKQLDPSTHDDGHWYRNNSTTSEKFIRFTVRDYGKGISSIKMKDLFIPFAHLKDGEISKGRSPGIGLAICKEIASLHRGSIFCHSDGEGQGASFTFVFPFRTEDAEHAHQYFVRMDRVDTNLNDYKVRNFTHTDVLNVNVKGATVNSSKQTEQKDMSTSSTSLNKVNTGDLPGTSASNSLQENGRNAEVIYLDPGFHVLVVDDVTSNRKLLGKLLQRRNAQVDMAVDGVDALEKVMGQDNLNHYRIIFLDNTMPNMTGIQCAEELRVRGYSNLIIGVTGNSFEEEILEFSNVGADLVLSKPMKLSQLDILLRYSHEHGFASQYIRGMNLFMDDERVIIWPRSSSNTIYQARSKIEEASKS